MDLLKFIKSLEELLYEAITWLLFYPRTLMLSLWRPLTLAAYTDVEMKEDIRKQFTDVVSPPLFLLLTLLLMHGVELALHHRFAFRSELANKLFESDTNILIFRAVLYSLFPLVMARGLLKKLGQPVDRDTLRGPFYAQCFFTAPLVLLTSIGGLLTEAADNRLRLAGACVWLASIGWYIAVETHWFRTRLALRTRTALALATRFFLTAFLIGGVVTFALIAPDVIANARSN